MFIGKSHQKVLAQRPVNYSDYSEEKASANLFFVADRAALYPVRPLGLCPIRQIRMGAPLVYSAGFFSDAGYFDMILSS
jgi:hypothetical protein